MPTPDEIERIRQAVMRFRELLDIMRGVLDDGERVYARLFSSFGVTQSVDIKEKDRQWQLAEKLIADVTPLNKAVMQVRFDARELDRAFEELYNIIASLQATDSESVEEP
jgi:hypothetical protein